MAAAPQPRRPPSGPHVSIQLPFSSPPGGRPDPTRLVEAAAAAEAQGFDAVWVGDHIRHRRAMFESLVALCFAAANTTRIELECSVMLLALRRLPVVAKQIATLACFAPGRIGVGVGVGGEFAEEWQLCGVPLATRGAATDLAIVQLCALLQGRPLDINGLDAVVLDPLPPAPVPIFSGGRRRAALRRAAQHADGWVGWLHSPTAFAALRGELGEQRELSGNPEPLWFGMQIVVLVDAATRDHDAGEQLVPGAGRRYTVAGSADDVARELRRYWDAGATRFKLAIADGDRHAEQVRAVAEQILPVMRTWGQADAAGR